MASRRRTRDTRQTGMTAPLSTMPASAMAKPRLFGGHRLQVADGSIEALKWIALVAMLLDHVNKYLFGATLPVLFELGRIAMPLFGFVLAYNLARPDASATGAHRRTARRLLAAGTISQLPYAALGGSLWPLNILFTLLASVLALIALQSGGRSRIWAVAALVTGAGMLVEFLWFGIANVLAAWWFCRKASPRRLAVWLASTAALGLVNGNLWSLMAPWLVLVASQLDAGMPRHPRLFYAAYPLHLVLIWAAKAI